MIGTKTPTTLLETPQSISVVTREQMDTQPSASTSQALRYTAGANSERFGGFGGQLDITRIRGIDADYYLDGLRVISNVSTWSPQIDAYSLERVEVLRGPSSVLYGQGTGGGVVNQVSRRPQAQSAHEVFLKAGNFNRYEIGLDSTGALNKDASLLYRFTATGLNSQTQVEDMRHKRVYLAPAITWKPSDQTTWTVLATYSDEPEIPDYNSLPAVALGLDGSPYAQVNRHRNFNDVDFNGSSREQHSLSSLFTHKFANDWSLNSNFRYMYINSDTKRTTVYGYQDRDGQLWFEGTYGLAPSNSRTFQFDNNVAKKFTWGDWQHQVLLGVDYAHGKINNDSYRMNPIPFNPFAPNDYRPHAQPDFSDSMNNWPYNVRQEFDRVGVYAQDQIAYQKWRLTLSGRHDWSTLDDESRNYTPVWHSSRQRDTQWSGRIGLNYVFDLGIAPYISYATSFDPVLGNDYNGNAFSPTEAKQAEIGIKYQPSDAATLLSAAVFQLDQENVKTSDTEHLGYWTQSGKVRSRGIELQATTQLMQQLNLMASYVYLDNELTQDANYKGKSLTQTPKHSASAWLDYRFDQAALAGLQVGFGVRYLGSSWGNPVNSFKVPDATLFDLALHYDLGQLSNTLTGSKASFNVSNLTNKKYVASCTSQMYCFIGQDRVVSASLSYNW
ncbi:ferric siderophore receptor [Acinetobacter larvae]|uniref:Ferric siderophore receptor n=2 Tax=Acinetobacter larvae TaxID=1789224 RepID=A0A1B2M478_9GAMM|nr:ferric siderophore receptor [Acinetobacter larvae]